MHDTMDVYLVDGIVYLLRKNSQLYTARSGKALVTDSGGRIREDDDFEEFTDTLHELEQPWSHKYVDVVILTFYFDWYGEISLIKNLCGLTVSGEFYNP